MVQLGTRGYMVAKPLSKEEDGWIFELDQKGFSQKEIQDRICKEFNRETLDRSTLHRSLRRENLRRSGRIPVTSNRLPQTPGQQRFWERCIHDDHDWMKLVVVPDCCTESIISSNKPPREVLLTEGYGKWTSATTCWFCGFTTEPRDHWGIVLVSAE